jgi:hypothetical protein
LALPRQALRRRRPGSTRTVGHRAWKAARCFATPSA